jgi:hypothetical protein
MLWTKETEAAARLATTNIGIVGPGCPAPSYREGMTMEVLKQTECGVTVELSHEEIGYLADALFVLDEHPTSEGGNYIQRVNRLCGRFEMLGELRMLAEEQAEKDGSRVAP